LLRWRSDEERCVELYHLSGASEESSAEYGDLVGKDAAVLRLID